MSFSYTVSADGKSAWLIGSGDGGAEAARAATEKLAGDPRLGSTFVLLVDARGITPPPSPEAVRAVIAVHTRILGKRTPRVALLASPGVLYGIGRQMGIHLELDGTSAQVFTDEREAYEWLQCPPLPPPTSPN